jgi:hypothetical protein
VAAGKRVPAELKVKMLLGRPEIGQAEPEISRLSGIAVNELDKGMVVRMVFPNDGDARDHSDLSVIGRDHFKVPALEVAFFRQAPLEKGGIVYFSKKRHKRDQFTIYEQRNKNI